MFERRMPQTRSPRVPPRHPKHHAQEFGRGVGGVDPCAAGFEVAGAAGFEIDDSGRRVPTHFVPL